MNEKLTSNWARKDVWINEWRWMNEWMDGLVGEWMNGWSHLPRDECSSSHGLKFEQHDQTNIHR